MARFGVDKTRSEPAKVGNAVTGGQGIVIQRPTAIPNRPLAPGRIIPILRLALKQLESEDNP